VVTKGLTESSYLGLICSSATNSIKVHN